MLLALRSLWEPQPEHGDIIQGRRRKPKGQPLFFDWSKPSLNLAKMRQSEEEEIIMLALSDL